MGGGGEVQPITRNVNRNGAPIAAGSRHAWWLLLFLLPGLVLGADGDGPNGAVDLVKESTRRLLEAIDRDRASIEQDPARARRLVEQFVLPHVDMLRISRLVLGRHWRNAAPPQQTLFVDAFKVLLVRTYATAVTEYLRSDINYLTPRLHRNKMEVTVKTEVSRPSGPPTVVNYRMRRSGHTWKVVDVVIEGISLVATYRNAFGVRVRRDGLDQLINDIIEKNRG